MFKFSIGSIFSCSSHLGSYQFLLFKIFCTHVTVRFFNQLRNKITNLKGMLLSLVLTSLYMLFVIECIHLSSDFGKWEELIALEMLVIHKRSPFYLGDISGVSKHEFFKLFFGYKLISWRSLISLFLLDIFGVSKHEFFMLSLSCHLH